jgi:hypothetical protein
MSPNSIVSPELYFFSGLDTYNALKTGARVLRASRRRRTFGSSYNFLEVKHVDKNKHIGNSNIEGKS